ncbi:MAG: tRNA lysidine(34) synthetase TilS [Elusimicrobiota bacterium]|jgi:tRNA(Ile)-lysidine synthase|nr:tRNA lysidine(34) synthetase TilS [Elusimicrobiota bacterium]
MKTIELFYKNTAKNKLIQSGDKIIIAVSGGADSISLAHLLWRLSKKINIFLTIVHFDHGLRLEAVKEKKLVNLLSNAMQIPFYFQKLSVKKYAKKCKISIETAGRDLRYAALEQIAKEKKFNKIATAHNANDNAETVLMWLLRGGGNFSGIPQRRLINKNLEIIRPLLPIKRKLIDEYIKEQQLSFCTDKSNFSDEFTRNKIRHAIIPHIEKINNKAIEHIFEISRIQSLEDDYMNEICAKLIAQSVKKSKNSVILDLNRFLGYNAALRYRILKEALPEKKNSYQINFLMEKILSFDKSPHQLSNDWVFKLNDKKAVFKRK